jgi:hypothetical protein
MECMCDGGLVEVLFSSGDIPEMLDSRETVGVGI